MQDISKIYIRIIEGIAAVLLVLLCFVFFSDLLDWIFPSNLSSKQLSSSDYLSEGLHPANWRQLVLNKNGVASDLGTAELQAARIDRIDNSLKCKRAGGVAWQAGAQGMALFSGDAVQTMDRSSAWIRLDELSRIRLEERTLIVIKRLEDDLIFDDRRSHMIMLEGQLRVNIATSDGQDPLINLKIPTGSVLMHSRHQLSESRVTVGADNRSTVAVYKGSVEIAAGEHQLVVQANQAVRLTPGQPFSEIEPLPLAVAIESPADGANFFSPGGPLNVEFNWQKSKGATAYHFILARDVEFSDIVAEHVISGNRLDSCTLAAGTYFWHVSAIDQDVEGYFSDMRQFSINQQARLPVLSMQSPPEHVFYRDQPPVIDFAWQQAAGTREYYWQLARDKDFKDIVSVQKIRGNQLARHGLHKGIYHWRVGLKDAADQPIRYSSARSFRLIQDRTPPDLESEFPANAVFGEDYVVTGSTEPGASVYVGGILVDVSSAGRFSHAVRLVHGKNLIAVAATDRANNVTSRSHIVFCK